MAYNGEAYKNLGMAPPLAREESLSWMAVPHKTSKAGAEVLGVQK